LLQSFLVGENTNKGGSGFKVFLLVKTPTRAVVVSKLSV
jgi:hypothetical protein